MKTTRFVLLRNLNPHIGCPLCGGYIIEPTRISECLHVFCKSCVVQFVSRTPVCPTCDLEIPGPLPLANLVADHLYEDIIFKLLPSIKEEEKQRRIVFEEKKNTEMISSHNYSSSTVSPSESTRVNIFFSKQTILPGSQDIYNDLHLNQPYMNCDTSITVSDLKLLFYDMTSLSPKNVAIILYCRGRVLRNDETVREVQLCHWSSPAQPIEINFRLQKAISSIPHSIN